MTATLPMMMFKQAWILILTPILAVSVNASGQKMNNAHLKDILESVTDTLEGESGMWQFTYSDRMMVVITDEHHDRMRIISPIELMEEVTPEDLHKAMVANFHSVLDARYAVSDDILWAAFLHPLKALSEEQVRDAMQQVYRAAETYGSSFSSTELVFPGADQPVEGEKIPRKKM